MWWPWRFFCVAVLCCTATREKKRIFKCVFQNVISFVEIVLAWKASCTFFVCSRERWWMGLTIQLGIGFFCIRLRRTKSKFFDSCMKWIMHAMPKKTFQESQQNLVHRKITSIFLAFKNWLRTKNWP